MYIAIGTGRWRTNIAWEIEATAIEAVVHCTLAPINLLLDERRACISSGVSSPERPTVW